MKCDLSPELLSGYLDGELDKEQRELVEKHLEQCQSCREELKALEELDQRIRSQEVEGPSREFIFRVNKQVMRKIGKKKRFSFFQMGQILVPVAVAALVLIIVVNLPKPTRRITVDDQVHYTEGWTDKDLEVSIPILPDASRSERERVEKKIVTKGGVDYARSKQPPVSAGKAAEISTAEEAPEEIMDARKKEEHDDIAELQTIEKLEIPHDRVVRAIVDTSGTIIRVATGNTIIPEQDTMLENRLMGQQVAPATVSGRRTQLYVDFTQEKKDSN